jgi:hypothetical protein
MVEVLVKPETKFRTTKVRPFLKTLKNTAFFAIQQMAISGDPDYILCIRGKFVALELKDVGKKPRKLQQYRLDEVRMAGGVALVADPENWEWVKGCLLRLSMGGSNDPNDVFAA